MLTFLERMCLQLFQFFFLKIIILFCCLSVCPSLVLLSFFDMLSLSHSVIMALRQERSSSGVCKVCLFILYLSCTCLYIFAVSIIVSCNIHVCNMIVTISQRDFHKDYLGFTLTYCICAAIVLHLLSILFVFFNYI